MEEYDVRLTNHAEALLGRVNELRKLDCFADVLLYCEDRVVRAHKVILASSSAYWDAVFRRLPADFTATRFPLVVMPEIPVAVLELVLEFIYLGQVSVPCERMQEFMDLADTLQIRGFHDAKRPPFTLPTPGQTAVTPEPPSSPAVGASISSPPGPSPTATPPSNDLITVNNNNNNNSAQVVKRVKREAVLAAAAEVSNPVPKKPSAKAAPAKKRGTKRTASGVRRSLRDRQQRNDVPVGEDIPDRAGEEEGEDSSQGEQPSAQPKQEVPQVQKPAPKAKQSGPRAKQERIAEESQVTVTSGAGTGVSSSNGPTPDVEPIPDLCVSEDELVIPPIVSEHDEITRFSDFMWKGTGKSPRTTVFFCSLCGFTTQWSKVARDHERVHTGERPFLCPICNRKFSVRSNLRRHLRNIHKQKLPGTP